MKVLIVECNSQHDAATIVLNFELAESGKPPEEIMLVPAGDLIKGRDGRTFRNSGRRVIDFFTDRGLKIPIDIEHATELKAPKGEPAPAMAWCTSLEAKEDGSVWGKVEWTNLGYNLVANKAYSYYSPAYYIDKDTNIVGVKSVGLTNNPNLRIPALNSEDPTKGALHMNLEELLASLGLPAGTTFAAALNHIAQMKANLTTALNQANNPPLDKFVPKQDYDLAVNRANEAETKLTAQVKQNLDTAINTEIESALAAGKITPATKEYHIAQCQHEGGLDRFKEFVKSAPAVAANSGLDGKSPDKDIALNAEELKIAAMFGNSVEDIKKYGQA